MRLRSPRVVQEGRVVRTDRIDPGSPLLHSRFEWKARYRRYLVVDMVIYAVVLAVLMSVVAGLLYLVLPDVRLGVLLVVVVTAAVVLPELWARLPVGLEHPPGLYKEGLVHPKGFLVPYGELVEVQVLHSLIPLAPAKLYLVPYFEQPGEDYTEWYLHYNVLGEKGVRLFQDEVRRINEELED